MTTAFWLVKDLLPAAKTIFNEKGAFSMKIALVGIGGLKMPSTPKQRKKYALTYRGRATKMWHNAKRRSGLKNSEVTITVEWIEEKLKKGFCEYTGLPFDLNSSTEFSSNPYSPSLDKINPKIKSYTPENTRVVLTCVNRTLSEYGEDIILPILKSMVSAIENRQCR